MAASSSSTARTCDIVVVGSCNVDMCTYCGPRFPIPGETILGTEYKQGFGGKGSNQAVMAAKLSPAGTVAMVGCVGTDLHGDGFRKAMVDAGIDVTLLASAPDGVATGTAAILIDASGENCVVVVPGANMQVTEDVVTSEDVAAKITSAKVVVTQNEIPEAATATTVALASGAAVERGFPITVSNPAPAPDVLAPALCADIDILVLNESEAASLAGKDTPAIGNSATEAEVEAFVLATADRLRPPKDNRGRVLVVTRGSKGAAVAVVPASGSSGATAVIMVKGSAARRMADTVGAGDAFVGALAATLSRVGDAVVLLSDAGKVSQAVERACAVATMTVEHQGTQTSYPTREQALERIPHLESAL